MDDIREKLAELSHNQWAGWMRYLFRQSSVNTNGEVIIPVWAVDRWKRQTESSYSDIPEKEKDSDREEADRVIAIFEPGLARLRAERDELRAAAKRLSEERQSGLASLDAWVQLRAALSRTEGGEK